MPASADHNRCNYLFLLCERRVSISYLSGTKSLSLPCKNPPKLSNNKGSCPSLQCKVTLVSAVPTSTLTANPSRHSSSSLSFPPVVRSPFSPCSSSCCCC